MRTLADSVLIAHNGEALRARAWQDGYLFFRGLPGAEAIASLRKLVEDVAESLGLLVPRGEGDGAPKVRPGAALTGTGYDDERWVTLQKRVLGEPCFAELGDHPRLIAVLEAVLAGPVLTRRGDICRVALPNATHLTTPPHQDHWYTGGSTNLWTVWIALTDMPLELGPLAVLPRSHIRGLLPHDGEGAGRQGVHVEDADAFAAANLAAGDAIMFNCLTVHRALPNLTGDRVRLSVDYRYQPAAEPIDVLRVDGTRAGR